MRSERSDEEGKKGRGNKTYVRKMRWFKRGVKTFLKLPLLINNILKYISFSSSTVHFSRVYEKKDPYPSKIPNPLLKIFGAYFECTKQLLFACRS